MISAWVRRSLRYPHQETKIRGGRTGGESGVDDPRLPPPTYSIDAMTWGTVELEPEVRAWLEELTTSRFATAAFYIDLLAEEGPLVGEPYTRQLDGKLRELRFHLDR